MLSQTISARYRRRLMFVCSVSQRSGSETSDSGINGVHFTELSWTSVFISAKSVATIVCDAVLAFAPRHVLQWAGDDPAIVLYHTQQIRLVLRLRQTLCRHCCCAHQVDRVGVVFKRSLNAYAGWACCCHLIATNSMK